MKRVVYKIVGMNGLGKEKLVYIGQTTNFERRVGEHKKKLREAVAIPGNSSASRKYQRLRKCFKAGRVYFEKLDEGDWTWEEALMKETEVILEYRTKHKNLAVLNEIDSPHDGKMPDGRLVWVESRKIHLLRVFAGLTPGADAIALDSKVHREIVTVTKRVAGPDRGIETWEFLRSGIKWTAGKMPLAVGMRVYRGRLLEIYKRSGKELFESRPGDYASSATASIPANANDLAKLKRKKQPKKASPSKLRRKLLRRLNREQSKAEFGIDPKDVPPVTGRRKYEVQVKITRDEKGRREVRMVRAPAIDAENSVQNEPSTVALP